MYNKVIKCDKKNANYQSSQLIPRGVFVPRPPHQGSLVGTNLKIYTQNKNEIQSSLVVMGDMGTL
jgi:hypothetical protein